MFTANLLIILFQYELFNIYKDYVETIERKYTGEKRKKHQIKINKNPKLNN